MLAGAMRHRRGEQITMGKHQLRVYSADKKAILFDGVYSDFHDAASKLREELQRALENGTRIKAEIIRKEC